MKRSFLLILVMGAFYNVLAQTKNEWWLNWDELTRDSAYLAPNSMITKKWYKVKKLKTDSDESYTFNANGTFIHELEYNMEVPLKATTKGTWKRNKQFLTIIFNYETSVITPDKEKYSALSLRRQDDLKTILNETVHKMRKWGTKTFSYQMLRLNNDVLILADKVSISGTMHFVTQEGTYLK